jgi:hypothetical protein
MRLAKLLLVPLLLCEIDDVSGMEPSSPLSRDDEESDLAKRSERVKKADATRWIPWAVGGAGIVGAIMAANHLGGQPHTSVLPASVPSMSVFEKGDGNWELHSKLTGFSENHPASLIEKTHDVIRNHGLVKLFNTMGGSSPSFKNPNSRFAHMQGTTKGPSVKRGGFRMTRA